MQPVFIKFVCNFAKLLFVYNLLLVSEFAYNNNTSYSRCALCVKMHAYMILRVTHRLIN